jgi:tetratricopeptide (TPR) repeat protein
MSRFGNLEFDGEAEGRSQPSRAQVKDEAYYCAEARGAFANGQFEAALRLYSKVLEFSPYNTEAWAGQARMLIELGECGEALLWANKALEQFPNDPELLAVKAVALARTGDTQAAMAFSDSAVHERGDTPYVWLARGDVLLAREESRADYCFERAMALAPGDWFIAWLAARIHYYYGRFAMALKFVQQALEWNSAHFLLWLELGRCQQALGLMGAARNSLSQARQLNPLCAQADTALRELSTSGFWPRLRGLWRRLF